MTPKPYGMICPITRACEILEPRWTIPILVSLWDGATKFNDIRRDIGSISPALLSRRLKELEAFGLIERIEDQASGSVDYIRTDMAIALEPALHSLAHWAQGYIEAEFAVADTNVEQLMWGMRRRFRREAMPDRRCVIQFRFSDEGLDENVFRAVVVPGAPVEICTSIDKLEVDLFVETSAPSWAGIIQNRTTIAREIELGELFLSGDAVLARTMPRWLILSEYADVDGVRQLPDTRGSCLAG